jgi:hypothetical protein
VSKKIFKKNGELLMKNYFEKLPVVTQDRLEKIHKAVSGVVPDEIKTWSFNTKELVSEGDPPHWCKEVKVWFKNGCSYLYVISINTTTVSYSEIFDTYKKAKSQKKGGRAYARPQEPSPCLYVGSSEKIHQRLKEHLGLGAAGTYALQLAHWANAFDLELNFLTWMLAQE